MNINMCQFQLGTKNKLNLYGQDLMGNVYLYTAKQLTNQKQMSQLYRAILAKTIASSKSPTGCMAVTNSDHWTKVR